MTIRTFSLLAALILVISGCTSNGSGSSTNLDTIDDASVIEQASYLLGYQMGSATSSQMDSVDVALLDMDILMAGVREALEGDSIRMEEASAMRTLSVFTDTLFIRGLRRDASSDTSAQQYLDEVNRNIAAADSFFSSLEGTDSLETAENELRYVVLTPPDSAGAGSPEVGDRVQIEVRTTLVDGSLIRGLTTAPGEPAEFVVSLQQPQGLHQALLSMEPGESRRIFVPADMAFGLVGFPAGPEDRVPPASPIILEVTLHDILDPIDPALLRQMQEQAQQQAQQAPPVQ